jgi:hypothetical protein
MHRRGAQLHAATAAPSRRAGRQGRGGLWEQHSTPIARASTVGHRGLAGNAARLTAIISRAYRAPEYSWPTILAGSGWRSVTSGHTIARARPVCGTDAPSRHVAAEPTRQANDGPARTAKPCSVARTGVLVRGGFATKRANAARQAAASR